jgi:hypothetical protein
MFRPKNNDAYVGLQAPSSTDEAIQPTVIVEGSIVTILPHRK